MSGSRDLAARIVLQRKKPTSLKQATTGPHGVGSGGNSGGGPLPKTNYGTTMPYNPGKVYRDYQGNSSGSWATTPKPKWYNNYGNTPNPTARGADVPKGAHHMPGPLPKKVRPRTAS